MPDNQESIDLHNPQATDPESIDANNDVLSLEDELSADDIENGLGDEGAKARTPEQVESKRKSGLLKQIIKVVVSVALMFILLRVAGVENTFARLSKANLWYLPLGVFIYLTSQAISTYRWQFLAKALDFHVPFWELYRYYLVGMFFNMFLPGSIGGDTVRLVYLARRCQRRKRETLLTLLAERGVGLVALLILTSVVSLLPILNTVDLSLPLKIPGLHTLSLDVRFVLLGLSAAMLIGYGLLYILPLEKLIKRFPPLRLIQQASIYWHSPILLFKSISMSIVVHGLMVLIHLCIAAALGIHMPTKLFLPYLAVTYGIVSLASVIPISANGFGVREGIYWLLLTRLGFSGETALAFAFYWDAVSILTSLPGGLFIIKPAARGKKKAPASN